MTDNVSDTASGSTGWRLEVERRADWPKLAWLAVCPRGARTVQLTAGAGVEVRDDWFGELVWAGDHQTAAFDTTELVFGSGARLRGDEVVFVSAGQTADRLHVIENEQGLVVSNSLPCVLAATGVSLRHDVDYRKALLTVRGGIHAYQETIPVSDGEIRLVYFHNLVWNGDRTHRVAKPAPRRDFSSFSTYEQFLTDTTAAFVANMRAPGRSTPLEPIASCSAGYDSSTVAVLTGAAGCVDVIGIETTRDGADDSGAAVAEALGMTFHGFAANAWSQRDDIEPRFIAAGVGGGSSIPLRAAEPLLMDRVLFTGYHGDKMWDRESSEAAVDHPRVDLGGCDLMEFRLSAGFCQIMLPMLGSHQMAAVHAMSKSEEMRPWSVGGGYDRPICRRIVEEAGVPRDAFARKKGAMQQWVVLTGASLRDFEAWSADAPDLAPAGPAGEGGELRAGRMFLWAVERAIGQYRG